jgi:pSer/pThr/pTyr-binding forkhead associated (FHA) protein
MATATGGVPSHLVLDGQAYRLSNIPLRIGTEAAAGEYSLVIDARHKGVSRRHCSIELSGDRVLMNDHSRYGTLLNGHRVNAAAVLQRGDIISVGDPACELKLIVETGPAGQDDGA